VPRELNKEADTLSKVGSLRQEDATEVWIRPGQWTKVNFFLEAPLDPMHEGSTQDPHSQKALQRARDTVTAKQLLRSLPISSSQAAWLLSGSCRGSALWLNPLASADPRCQLSPEDFRHSLRLRLLLPLDNTLTLGTRLHCKCEGEELVAGIDDHHAFSCPLSSGLRSERHALARDAVFDFLCSALSTTTVLKEYAIPGAEGRGSIVDICLISDSATYYLDLAIVNPGGTVHRRYGSAEYPGVAWKRTTLDKKALYARRNLANIFLVPFVIEAGGRWGDDAVAFINTTCGVKIPSTLKPASLSARKRHLRTRIAVILAQTNSTMWTRSRDHTTPLQPQVPWSRLQESPLITEVRQTRNSSHLRFVPPKARARILSQVDQFHLPASWQRRPRLGMSCQTCYDGDWEHICRTCGHHLCPPCWDVHDCLPALPQLMTFLDDDDGLESEDPSFRALFVGDSPPAFGIGAGDSPPVGLVLDEALISLPKHWFPPGGPVQPGDRSGAEDLSSAMSTEALPSVLAPVTSPASSQLPGGDPDTIQLAQQLLVTLAASAAAEVAETPPTGL
jgi:hypothetical protein